MNGASSISRHKPRRRTVLGEHEVDGGSWNRNGHSLALRNGGSSRKHQSGLRVLTSSGAVRKRCSFRVSRPIALYTRRFGPILEKDSVRRIWKNFKSKLQRRSGQTLEAQAEHLAETGEHTQREIAGVRRPRRAPRHGRTSARRSRRQTHRHSAVPRRSSCRSRRRRS